MGRGGAASDGKPFDKLVGHKNFVRQNPMSDRFTVHKFHHIEFYTADATNTYNRFAWGLGMQLVAKSDQSTGNGQFASYVLQSNDLVFAFTAPYGSQMAETSCNTPQPWYNQDSAYAFLKSHGMAARAVGLLVDDAEAAFSASVQHGATPVTPPTTLRDEATGTEQQVAAVILYGDVVLRYISGSFQGPFLAGYAAVQSYPLCYGLQRLDHAVGNTPHLLDTVNYIAGFTGFHEFAEFTAEDVGTVDSGLNSMVLASNNEMVLLPVNEPTHGTKRKSQIQTYLEQNEGPGLQHLALKTDDIFSTMREMRQRSGCGGFEFMPRASDEYYKNLPEKIGPGLTEQQYKEIEELGLLADKDDQGILLQIFTRPVGDRPTIFLEIIQRVGCEREVEATDGQAARTEQIGGCGGFGKGNFSELFRSIEDYERTLQV